jgi:HEAT repeat protein
MKIVNRFLLASICLGMACSTFAQTPASTAANAERAKDFLEEALKDKNPETRKHAVQALSLVSAREPWLTRLETALDDKDLQVQLSAIASLLDLKTDRTAPALQKALASNIPEVSFAAAKALWTLKQPSGENALLSVLSGEVKTSSGFFTNKKRDTLRLMHTPGGMFLFIVTTGAAVAPVPGLGYGASSAQGILSDPNVSGRASAALLLSEDKDPRVVDALRDALNDKDWSVRAAAAHALAQRNDPSQAAALVPLFEDKKDGVRVRAAAAYLRLTSIPKK